VPVARVTGLWVYQSLGDRPDPDDVAARAQRHGLRWLTAEALVNGKVHDADWLREMRRATRERGLRLGVHGYVGRPEPAPAADAQQISRAIAVADADFAIVNAEIEYEKAAGPVSKQFVDAYRRLRPRFRSYFSSFGRPSFHASLNWQAWADGGFRGMPQAYENLNAQALKPRLCVDDYARFFPRDTMRPTLGCFEEHGQARLSVTRLAASVRDVPDLRFNVYRHGTVTDAELEALAALR
jgi:hypothetical protein